MQWTRKKQNPKFATTTKEKEKEKSHVDINIQLRYQTICQNHVKSDKQ